MMKILSQLLSLALILTTAIVSGAQGGCFDLPSDSCDSNNPLDRGYQFCSPNCDASGQCNAQAGKPFPVSILFTVAKTTSSVKAVAKAGMFFTLLNEDACITRDLACPIQPNTNTTYAKDIQVPSVSPAGKFDIIIDTTLDATVKCTYTLKGVVVTK